MPLNQVLNAPVSNTLVGSTTLSGAISVNQNNLTVASATGIVTPSLASGQSGSYLFINGEMLYVTGVGSSTTNFLVKRAVNGTQAQPHLSGAIVWIGNAATSSGDSSRPTSSALFPMLDASPVASHTPYPAPGSTPSSAVPVAGTIYYSQVYVVDDRPAKGIFLLNGSVAAGTDNHIVALYDFDGNLLAKSAATATANASLYQSIPFTTPVQISGGRSYFIAFQSNGTTDTVQKQVTGSTASNYQCGSVTGTSGTIPATLAIAGTFTTATGPIGGIY